MATCMETCHHAGTCCCVKYVCFTTGCYIFLALALLLFLAGFQIMESIDADDHVDVLLRFWEAKAAMLVTCIFFFVLGCVGCDFAGKKRRLRGLCLLVLALIALAWQVYVLGHVVASERGLAQFDEWFGSDLSQHERLEEFLTTPRNNTMKNWYLTFHDAMKHWECEVEDDSSKSLALTSSGQAGEGAEPSFLRALRASSTDRCDRPKSVECDERAEFASWTEGFCVPSGDGVRQCTNCLDTFLNDFVLSRTDAIDDDFKTELQEGFNGDVGTLFCRCMPITLEVTENYYRLVLIITLVYISIQVLFVLAILWLVVCGPDATSDKGWETSRSGDEQAASSPIARFQNSQLLEQQWQMELARQEQMQQRAGPTHVQVVCPPDTGPGDQILINFEGRQTEVTVPAGVWPGMRFNMHV